MKLNTEQQAAVNHGKGCCIVTSIPGSGKCVVGDTIISSMSGPFISQIQDNELSSLLSCNKESCNNSRIIETKINKFVDSGLQPTIQIETDKGFCLQGTLDHPVIVLNSNGYLEWKTLEHIKVGDYCPIWTNKKYERKIHFSPKYYLMGLLLGNGHLAGKHIAFCSENNNISKLFCDIVDDLYDYKVKITKDKRCKSLFSFYILLKRIKLDLINTFGDIEHLACSKYLTPKMLNGSLEDVSSLLSGLFDTDGYCNNNTIDIVLCSKKMIDQIQILLLHFGVFSRKSIKTVKGKDYYRISIHGNDHRRFVKNIGFRHLNKQCKLSRLSNPNKVIPNSHELVRAFRDEVRSKEWWNRSSAFVYNDEDSVRLNRYCVQGKNSRRLTDQSINRILSICKSHSYSSDITKHLSFLSDNFSFVKIIKTNKLKTHVQVYDYVVPGSHNFISNGFISHNTRTLTSRVIRLINDGVKPENILCLTFTNKATEEMRERISLQINKDNKVWISTFHKLCVTILRKFGNKIGIQSNFSIVNDKDQIDLIKKIARLHERDIKDKNIDYLIRSINSFRENLTPYSDFIDQLTEENPAYSSLYASIVTEYINTLMSYQSIDFSGILYHCYRLLNQFPEIVKKLANRFRHILIDEMQDTNIIQYEFIKLIANHHGNLFAVGDYQQSIFGFRNATPDNINKFTNDFKNVARIILPKNYRSTTKILKIAENLIRHNDMAHDVYLESTREEGEDVKVYEFNSPEAEAVFICEKIKDLVETGQAKYSDCTVLYRSNALSKIIEQRCRHFGIDYQIIGGYGFFDRREIKDAIAYLTLLDNPHNSIAFHRAVSAPKRGIGNVTVGKIENACKKYKKNVFEICNNHLDELELTIDIEKSIKDFCLLYEEVPKGIVNAMKHFLDKSGYLNRLEQQDKQLVENRKANLMEFIGSMKSFSKLKKNATVQDFLHHISLRNIEKEDSNQSKIRLMTIHAAKGLEFKVVFIIGVEENLLPHFLSVIEKGDKGTQEERRLFFVAITRCKDLLFITHCKYRKKFSLTTKGMDRVVICHPSRFLEEICNGEFK